MLAGILGGVIGLWENYRGGPKRRLQGTQRSEVLEWSPDSATLASAGVGRSVMLWSRTGGLRRRLDDAPGRVLALGWSPDALTVAAAGEDDAQIRIWSVQDGHIAHLVPTAATAVSELTISSSCGKWLAAKDSTGRLRLWDTRSWTERAVMSESPGAGSGAPFLAFSPTSATLASYDASQGGVTVYSVVETVPANYSAVEAAPARPVAVDLPRKVFVSYAHADRKYLERLLTYLEPLKRESRLEIWSDCAIDAGSEWHEEIRRRLANADIIIFLISAAMLASDYITDVELRMALSRHQAKEAIVVPLILRTADWKRTPLGALQALPDQAKPITSWSNKDDAFQSVSDGLRRLIERPR